MLKADSINNRATSCSLSDALTELKFAVGKARAHFGGDAHVAPHAFECVCVCVQVCVSGQCWVGVCAF